MARHSSVSRAERAADRNKVRITNDLRSMTGDNKSLRFKDYDRLLGEAQRDMGIRCRLSETAAKGGEAAPTARRKLRELREVKYYVDIPVAAGDLYLTKPNRKVK